MRLLKDGDVEIWVSLRTLPDRVGWQARICDEEAGLVWVCSTGTQREALLGVFLAYLDSQGLG